MATTTYDLPGVLDPDSLEVRKGQPFMFRVFHDGEIKSPDEIEPGHPEWFAAPRYAKAAGMAFVARHADVVGFDVIKLGAYGHYRTVHTYWKPE